MKNRLIFGILFVVLGLFIALGPQSIFPICQASLHTSQENVSMETTKTDATASSMTSMNSPMKCFWTGRAELGIGSVISFLGILLILFRKKQVRFGLSLALGLNGILALLIPTILIGVCGSTRMDCRALTLPALSILSSLVILFAGINAVYLYKTDQGGNTSHEEKCFDDHTPVGS